MCRRIYDWNIANCDVKQRIHLTSPPHLSWMSELIETKDKYRVIFLSTDTVEENDQNVQSNGHNIIMWTFIGLVLLIAISIATCLCIIRRCSVLSKTSKAFKKGKILKEKRKRSDSVLYDKSPYTIRNIKRATWQHKDVTKKFDYTAIADRLRTV